MAIKCKHKWEPVSVKVNGDCEVYGEFVCQKCMSFKEEELKYVKRGKSE